MKRKKTGRKSKSSAAALLGAKGGKAGTGKSKARGNAEYYRQLVAKRVDRDPRYNGDNGDLFEWTPKGKRLAGFDKNANVENLLQASAKGPKTYHQLVLPNRAQVWAYKGQEISKDSVPF